MVNSAHIPSEIDLMIFLSWQRKKPLLLASADKNILEAYTGVKNQLPG